MGGTGGVASNETKAFPFTAPAWVTRETIVGIVVATGDPVSVDLETPDTSTRLMGLEIVPVEKPRPRLRRPNRKDAHQ